MLFAVEIVGPTPIPGWLAIMSIVIAVLFALVPIGLLIALKNHPSIYENHPSSKGNEYEIHEETKDRSS